jgi:chromosome segregation ATPase
MSMQIQSPNPVGPERVELQKRTELAVRVKSDQKTRPSEAVDNPLGRDKIELSKSSLAEELSLLKQKQEQKESNRALIDDLQNSLLRMESILYQAAASISFDADSLQVMQKRISKELKGAQEVFSKVDLPGLTKFDFEKLSESVEKAKLNSDREVEKLQKKIHAASKEVEDIKNRLKTSEDDERTSKALEIAHQNTAAALSNYNPRDIFAHADSVATALRENNPEISRAHGQIDHQAVISLVS